MIPSIFKTLAGFSNRSRKAEYLLTLVLRKDSIKAAIYEEFNGKMTLVGKSKEELRRLIDELIIEELLEICDRVIVGAEEKLPPNIQVTRTIFGISNDWQSSGKLTKETLEKLKRLKTDLELVPLGFVVTTDALLHIVAREDGAPINAILAEFGKKSVTVSVIRATRIAESTTTLLGEEALPVVLEKALKGFTSFEVLPSRIILFEGSGDLEEVQQACIAHPWTKSLPFLHAPRIEGLPSDLDERAIISGVANEMGLVLEGVPAPVAKSPDHMPEGEAKPEEEAEGEELAFGFVKDQDITKIEKSEVVEPVQEEIYEPPTEEKKRTLPAFLPFEFFSSVFAAATSRLSTLGIPHISIPFIKRIPLPRNVMLGLLILVSTTILYVLAYVFIPRATLELTVTPKVVAQERDILVDPTIDATDPEKGRVKGEKVSVTKQGKKSGNATGKKEVGERAAGEVTIYNKSTEPRTFAKGTVLSSNSLKFTLDDAVTVASASGDVFSATTPSTAKGKVTAQAIGEDSNLPSQTTFTVGTLSDSVVAAKNDNAFSGGTKKEVTVVTKKDQDGLLESLLADLEKEASSEFEKNGGDLRIVDVISQKLTERTFDKKIDEEAQNFFLSLSVEFQALGYKEEDMRNLFASLLSENEGEDFVLAENGISFTVTEAEKVKSDSMQVKVAAKASFIPKIDEGRIKKELTFEEIEKAKAYLTALPNVTDVEVFVSPRFPLLPNRLPMRSEAIKLDIFTK